MNDKMFLKTVTMTYVLPDEPREKAAAGGALADVLLFLREEEEHARAHADVGNGTFAPWADCFAYVRKSLERGDHLAVNGRPR